MKHLLYFLLFSSLGYAQIGIGTSKPEANAVLDLDSKNKGLLLPRVENIAAVTFPDEGMMIYDLSSNCIRLYRNKVWSTCLSDTALIANCTGFTGSYCTAPLSGSRFTVTITNPDFASKDFTPATTDVTLSGVTGVSVDAVSPNVTTTINAGASLVVTYTIAGTPTAGTLNATFDKQGMKCFGTTPVTAASSMTVTPLLPTTTLCVNTPLATITQTTTGVTAMGTPSGLPPGVTAVFSNNTITISGTPTVAATYNYSIPLTGIGCGTVAGGRITVTAASMTVTPASSSPTLCRNTPLSPTITHTTSANVTAIGTAIGLPAGLTPNRTGTTITISGTPTVAGTFNYTIPLTGTGCPMNATGTITVTAPSMTVTPASPSPRMCIGSPLLPVITHTTTNATNIGAATGLPSGVTAAWFNNTITLSGTPTVTGIYNYTIPLVGSGCPVNATGSIIVNPIASVSATLPTQIAVMNYPITNFTYTITNGTDIGTPIGLPPGVTAVRSGSTITVSGTPTAFGTFTFFIPVIGPGICSVNVTGTINVGRCGAKVSATQFKIFLCHNLGANTSLDPHDIGAGSHGAYIQWGKRGPNYTGDAVVDWMNASDDPSNGFRRAMITLSEQGMILPSWSQVRAVNGSWIDNIKTGTDPCPSGFRVPTQSEWAGVIANNTSYLTATWAAAPAVLNLKNGISFGPNASISTLTLPAAGRFFNSSNQLDYVGLICNYWSTTYSSSTQNSFILFVSTSVNNVLNDIERLDGCSVRCVSQ